MVVSFISRTKFHFDNINHTCIHVYSHKVTYQQIRHFLSSKNTTRKLSNSHAKLGGSIAQLVSASSSNPEVAGSNPVASITLVILMSGWKDWLSMVAILYFGLESLAAIRLFGDGEVITHPALDVGHPVWGEYVEKSSDAHRLRWLTT